MKKTVIHSFLGLLIASLLLAGITVSASAQTVSETQAAIKAKGANWVAGDNPVSRLTLQEKRNLTGLLPDPGQTTRPPTSQLSTVGLPPSIDWRNNGGNYVSSVKSQGGCSSCWAYASTAAAESAVMIASNTPNANLDLWEAVLISCCTNCSSGYCHAGYLGPAAAYMVSHGEPLQTCPATSCGYTCPNYTIKSYESVAQDVSSMKAAIANYGPIVVGMQVYNDFYNYMGGVYSYTGAGYTGGHAVEVIGYNDAGQYFIGKNSWDTSWGEAGFFRIAYSEVGGTSQFGQSALAYHGGDPTPPPPPPPPTCTYPIGDLFAASGGAGNIQVATSAGCAWSATSNAAWITFPSGGNGSGPGTLTYSVAPNTTSSRRTGTMTVPGGTYTVVQELGSGQCTYSLSGTSKSFTNAGGSDSITVTAGSSCAWTASANVSWINISSGSGTGSGTVNYSVQANTATSTRAGTITIADKSFTVSQAGAGCTYAISPTSNSFGAAAGTGSVNVTAPTGCAWTAASNTTSFLNVTSGASGSGNGTVNYSVAANTTTSQRNGTMTIAGQTFTATQSAMSCTYGITPSSNSFGAAAGTGSVNVTAPTGCAWTAASNTTSFLSVTSGASGSGNGTVNYSVAANTTTSQRNGTMTIAGQTFTATQSAMSCTYGITPSSNSFGAAAGTGSVNVTAPTGCAWTAASNTTSFLSVTSGASGSGNGTVNYSVAANTTTSQRNGTMTIAGQTFTATQSAMSCTYAISPSSNSFGAAAGTGTVNVTAPTGCAWTAASNTTSFLNVTSGASGSGNGTVNYSVAANTTTSQRNGTMTIAGQTFTATQSAMSCTYAISPSSNSFGAAAGTGTVNVTAPTGCAWTAASNTTSFLNVTSGASGSGNGTVNYSVAANTTTSQRSGTLTVAGQTFTATQSAMSCTYAISPSSNSFGAAAGTGTVNVTAPTGCAWTAASNTTSFLSVTSGASGSGNGTVTYSVTANNAAAGRTGTMTIAGQTFTATQAGVSTCGVQLSSGGFNFGYLSRQGSFQVTAASTCSWNASASAPWITFNSGATGKGNGTVIFTIDTNTGSARTGTISVNNSSLIVNQSGSTACVYVLSATSGSIAAAGGTGTVTVSAGSSCAWTAASNASWITVTGSGNGNGSVTYTVQTNTGTPRTGTLTIAGQTFTVSQAGSTTCSYAINPTSQNFTTTGGAGTINVTAASTCAWSAASNVSWLTINQSVRASGGGSVSYSVAANTGASRSGTLTIANQTFTVTQDGTSPTCQVSLNAGGFNVSYMGRQLQFQVYAASTCSWAVTPNAPWITIDTGSTGKGNGTVWFTAGANAGAARTGTISVNGSTLFVNEQAHP